METDHEIQLELEVDDELDIGVDKTDQTVPIPNQQVVQTTDTIPNPLYENAYGGNIRAIDMKEIYAKHNYVLAVCIQNPQNIGKWIFSQYITNENMNAINTSCILVRCSINILKNMSHLKQAKIVAKSLIQSMGKDGVFELNDVEIIVPLLDFSYGDSLKYIELFGPYTKNPFDIFKVITLCKYYGNSHSQLIVNALAEFISKSIDNKFWIYPTPEFNLTEQFMGRKFIYKPTGNELAKITPKYAPTDDQPGRIIAKLQETEKGRTYLHGIHQLKKCNDIADCIRNCPKRKYYVKNPITSDTNMIKQDINALFDVLSTEKEVFDMFNNFASSKQYCHLVINNVNILKRMKPLFIKFGAFYRYLLTYPILSFYIEECIFKQKALKDHRYVFDIDTAHELPFYPFSADDIHMTPYIPLPISQNAMNLPNNFWSLQLASDYNQYGIDTLEGFKRKYNLFTTGTPDHGILDGIDWSKFAVSGSMIPACVPKRSPLVDLVNQPGNTLDQQFTTFFYHYYNQSDIDLMCNEKLFFDFLDRTYEVYNIVKDNLTKIHGKDASHAIKFESIKSGSVVIHVNFIDEKLDEIKEYVGDDKIDKQWIISNLSHNGIKEYFYKKYMDYKLDENKRIRKLGNKNNPLHEEFLKLVDINSINLYIVDYKLDKDTIGESDNFKIYYMKDIVSRPVPDGENFMVLKICESIRIKIIKNPDDKSEMLLRNIEIFKTQGPDPFSTVAKFHLPCVRGFYNGSNVYLLPSCVCALMSGVNIDYKYFFGARDPIDIVNKYVTRGFGIILTDKEKEDAVKYNSEVDKWKSFGVTAKSKYNLLFKPKLITNEIFKRLKYDMKLSDDLYKHIDMKYITNKLDVVEWYKTHTQYIGTNKLINALDLKAIGKDGNIIPLHSWVFDAVYQTMS